jgi:AcrR family transcriptional regulator
MLHKSILRRNSKELEVAVGEVSITREALLAAAGYLLETAGPEAITTRAVCEVAEVTTPTLYHYFGDKNGLLDALVAVGIEEFLQMKSSTTETDDALADLIAGWRSFLDFTLQRPQLFRLLVHRVGDNPEILDAAMATTEARLKRLAAQGRLSTDVPFARRSLLALANGVAGLATQGVPIAEVESIGAFLLRAALRALIPDIQP